MDIAKNSSMTGQKVQVGMYLVPLLSNEMTSLEKHGGVC